MHFALPIRANWSTQDASKSADIKRCARSGPDYLEPKGLPAELKELSWTESATLGYKHTIWIQRILPANRDRALGYKTTPLKPRGENGLAVIQILQVIMTIANIEWLNLTFKRRRRLTETFCAVFEDGNTTDFSVISLIYIHKKNLGVLRKLSHHLL